MRIIYFVVVLFLASCQAKNSYLVSDYLTPQEQEDIKRKIIRYVGRSPEGLTIEERFYPQYDSFYQEQAKLHKFDAYFIQNDEHYFLISRNAPSLVEKRVATAGKFKLNDKRELITYEEVFRTWKMTPDTLAKRSLLLFDKFVKGESLKSFEPSQSNGIEYIEFPDDQTYYDKENRLWRNKLLN